jgi:hypothetical protein
MEISMVEQLSQATKAVLNAFRPPDTYPDDLDEISLAIAIRAAVAHTQQYQGKDCLGDEVWTCDADELLAIATELEQLHNDK